MTKNVWNESLNVFFLSLAAELFQRFFCLKLFHKKWYQNKFIDTLCGQKDDT